MKSIHVLAMLCACSGLLLTDLSRAGDGAKSAVTLKRNPGTVAEQVIDPRNPPAIIRDLIGKQQAYTRNEYTLDWSARDDLKSQSKDGNEVVATVIIRGLDVTLNLATTFYLPDGASKKLREHEAGHKRIGEVLYDGAEADVRKLADSMITKSFTGRGATLDKARKAATKAVGDGLTARYLAAVQQEGDRVQEIYDELTAHGGNATLPEDEAIRQAFEQRKKDKANAAKK